MSCYNRERGVITLPTSAVATVKKAVRDANNAEHERIYQLGRKLYEAVGGRKVGTRYGIDDFNTRCQQAGIDFAHDDDFNALHDLCASGGKIRAPKRADVYPRTATNKANSFDVGYEAGVTFSGRTVEWYVSENNHAVEHARSNPVAHAFFAALSRVKWTRGTGGVIEYDDEYHRDSWSGPSISDRFGPLGERASSPLGALR